MTKAERILDLERRVRLLEERVVDLMASAHHHHQLGGLKSYKEIQDEWAARNCQQIPPDLSGILPRESRFDKTDRDSENFRQHYKDE
jgi:hypothetical protein